MPGQVINTPFSHWKLCLSSEHGLLKSVRWSSGEDVNNGSGRPDQVLKETRNWLECYFSAPENCLNGYVALHDFFPQKLVSGSYFNLVLHTIGTLPLGVVRTYGAVLKLTSTLYSLSDRGSSRSVGMACAANPFALLIPCHRVTGSGWLGGYCKNVAGDFIALKRELLRHEGFVFSEQGKQISSREKAEVLALDAMG